MRFLMMLSLIVALVGCSQAITPENVVEVSGSILMEGKPCRDAEVTFQAEHLPTVGRAVTNGNGKFVVDELLPGEYTVSIFRMSQDGMSIDPMFEKYAGTDSQLVAIVTPEKTTFDFDLTK
ncbi:carboxypeptidase-like regulatory domain-containing protein [Bremerella sp. JC817]|uniref:carboxypeptidase-like regulatory domain-containing protein n=1 Tax=Bremerella sp. JC817 TaxID=3231756 RepID=UPI00345A26DA